MSFMENNKQQTAVDFLMEKLKFINKEAYGELFNDGYDEANLMHKEQIIEAHKQGNKHNGWALRHEHEQYYNETYGKE